MSYGGTNEAWILGAVRTPIGRHGGALSALRPDDLGATVFEALMERSGVPPSEVEDVYFGCDVRHHLGMAIRQPEDGGDGPYRLSGDDRREPRPGEVPTHPRGGYPRRGSSRLRRLQEGPGPLRPPQPREQRRDDVGYGLATMCIGVGQGIAMVVEKAH
jgi:hypothetical protein